MSLYKGTKLVSGGTPKIPFATKDIAGLVKIGDGINVDEYGVISALGLPTKMPELDTSWIDDAGYINRYDTSGGFFRVGDLVYVNINVTGKPTLQGVGELIAYGFPRPANPTALSLHLRGGALWSDDTVLEVSAAIIDWRNSGYIEVTCPKAICPAEGGGSRSMIIAGFYYAKPES